MTGAVVTWTSNKTGIATVSAQGLVTATGNGTATITATVEDIFATATVRVIDDRRDREALTALYHSTDGPNWTNNDNWLSRRPLEEWFGVSVNAEDQVDSLLLRGNNLRGPIPAELGQLHNLRFLDLGSNDLTGPLPTELGQLRGLVWLDLGSNSLSGRIPKELGQLYNLWVLVLHGNQLTGPLPSTFTNLTDLELLDIRWTQLCAPTDAAFQSWLVDIRLKIGVVNCGEQDDHGNTRDEATSLALDGSKSGRIAPGNDVDYFEVEITEFAGFTVFTTGNLKTIGELEDSSGTNLATNNDGGHETNFRITRLVQPGTYYVKVESFSTHVGDYTVHARLWGL